MSGMLRANEMLQVLLCLGWCDCLRVFFTSERFKTTGECVFSNLWLRKSLCKEWLQEVKGEKHKTRCIMCMKDVDILSLEKWKICPWKSLKSPWIFSPKKRTNPELYSRYCSLSLNIPNSRTDYFPNMWLSTARAQTLWCYVRCFWFVLGFLLDWFF